MRKAIGAVIVFDITNHKSFNSVPYWIETLKERATEQIQMILAGNKIDKAHSRVVSFPDAEDMANRYSKKIYRYGIDYMEISAGDLNLLNKMFRRLCESTSQEN